MGPINIGTLVVNKFKQLLMAHCSCHHILYRCQVSYLLVVYTAIEFNKRKKKNMNKMRKTFMEYLAYMRLNKLITYHNNLKLKVNFLTYEIPYREPLYPVNISVLQDCVVLCYSIPPPLSLSLLSPFL